MYDFYVNMTLQLEVPHDYDMMVSVFAWIYSDIQPVPEITMKRTLSRLFTLDKKQRGLIIEQSAPGSTLRIYHESSKLVDRVQIKVENILGLNVDIDGAIREIQNDPICSNLAPRLRRIRPYSTDTVFEALIKSIIQQQISYRAANVLTKRLVLGLTQSRTVQGWTLFSFPSLDDFIRCGSEQLRSYGLGKKAEYIVNICELIESEELNLDSLAGRDYEEVEEVLKPIRGIGDWTVGALSIAGLANFTIFPYGDIGIRNLLGRLYSNNRRFSIQEVISKSDSWGKSGPLVLYLLMCANVLGLLESGSRSKTHKR